VGLLEAAIELRYSSNVCAFGIRLHPARAAAFLRVPARGLVNILAPLRHVSETLDARLLNVLRPYPRLDTAESRAALEAALSDHLRDAQPSDDLVAKAVDRLLGTDVATVSGLAGELGLSPRHLHRRFLAHVGISPKRLERLARFARAWQQAFMGPPL